jgi:outer membrane biosynthesis protein TonB
VVLVVRPNGEGDVQGITPIAGSPPFLQTSLAAVKKWKFAPKQKPFPVSVTLLYRPRQIFSTGGAGIEFQAPEVRDGPPLPRVILDPTYTVNSLAEGVVILELSISEAGAVASIATIRDEPSLTPVARRAVDMWKFSPTKGTAIVAISFLRPVV